MGIGDWGGGYTQIDFGDGPCCDAHTVDVGG